MPFTAPRNGTPRGPLEHVPQQQTQSHGDGIARDTGPGDHPARTATPEPDEQQPGVRHHQSKEGEDLGEVIHKSAIDPHPRKQHPEKERKQRPGPDLTLKVFVSRPARLTIEFKRRKISVVIADKFHSDTVSAHSERVKVAMGDRMSFSVDSDDLTGFGKQVKRAADDVEESRDYVKKSCEMLPSDVGPISTVAQIWDGAHKDVVNRVQNTLKALHKILTSSSTELLQSAKHYDSTDQNEARKMDATYPASKR